MKHWWFENITARIILKLKRFESIITQE